MRIQETRPLSLILWMFAAALSPLAASPLTAGDEKAAAVLKATRQALGGEEALEKVQSLTAAGRYRRVQREFEMSGELELDILLPDRYLKSEGREMMGSHAGTMLSAVDGDETWSDFRPGVSHGNIRIMMNEGGTEQERARRNQALRAEFARFVLALLLRSTPQIPLSVRYVGEAEAPDGRAHVLEAAGPDGFAATLFIDQAEHHVLMISYRGPEPQMMMMMRNLRSGQGGRRGDGDEATQPRMPGQAPEPEIVEFRLYFSEFESVDGVRLPQRVRRSVKGEVNEEWELAYKINPTIKPERFRK